MPKVRCSCGQKYILPDSAIGKRAKCKKCGAVFTVEAPQEAGPIPIADEPFPLVDDLDSAIARGQAPASGPAGAMVPPAPAVDMSKVGEAYKPGGRSYWQNLLWTFLFPASPGNLLTYAIICVVLTVLFIIQTAPFIPCFVRVLGFVIIAGLYCAFLFNTISSAAGGEEDLPSMTVSDWWEDAVVPLCRWITSWVYVLLPMLAYLLYLGTSGQLSELDPSVLTGGTSTLMELAFDHVILGALLYFGMFMWPMLALCVGLGGIGVVVRLDLIFVTIGRTLPIYLLTVGLVFGAFFLDGYLEELAEAQLMKQSGPIVTFSSTVVAIGAVGVLIATYFEIVAMRCIGLYYHHFKHRFAWDWG